MKTTSAMLSVAALVWALLPGAGAAAEVSGELKKWHKLTLTFDGPQTSEQGDPNPFMEYRLNVVFTHPASGTRTTVPGYYAADGNAANTSAHSGNKWRAHLAPTQTGEWEYRASFRKGRNVAVSADENAGEGDPTWQDGKGQGMIGAINYLASMGMNVFSFLPMNIAGDDRNVFPYTTYDERERLDVSRLDQWEIVFEHGTRKGMYLHFKTLETENELLLDNGDMGPHRALYYRELIARFGHHLALNWNLWEQCRHLLDFFEQQAVPFWDGMTSHDDLTPNRDDYVFAKPGERYLVYLKSGNAEFDLPEGEYVYGWFNPRTGEGADKLLASGRIAGPCKAVFTKPDKKDWLLSVTELSKARAANLGVALELSALRDFREIEVGSFTNPKVESSYEPKEATWEGVKVAPGDTIQVEFNTATNGADGWSRGRWTKLRFEPM